MKRTNKIRLIVFGTLCVLLVILMFGFAGKTETYHAPMEKIRCYEGSFRKEEYLPCVREALNSYVPRKQRLSSKEEAVLAGAEALRYMDSKTNKGREKLEVRIVTHCAEEQLWIVYCCPQDWTEDTTGTAFVIVFGEENGEMLGTYLN